MAAQFPAWKMLEMYIILLSAETWKSFYKTQHTSATRKHLDTYQLGAGVV